jgi:translation initiation factor 4G
MKKLLLLVFLASLSLAQAKESVDTSASSASSSVEVVKESPAEKKARLAEEKKLSAQKKAQDAVDAKTAKEVAAREKADAKAAKEAAAQEKADALAKRKEEKKLASHKKAQEKIDANTEKDAGVKEKVNTTKGKESKSNKELKTSEPPIASSSTPNNEDGKEAPKKRAKKSSSQDVVSAEGVKESVDVPVQRQSRRASESSTVAAPKSATNPAPTVSQENLPVLSPRKESSPTYGSVPDRRPETSSKPPIYGSAGADGAAARAQIGKPVAGPNDVDKNGKQLTSQQMKMKSCSAMGKGRNQADFREFMSECLKND